MVPTWSEVLVVATIATAFFMLVGFPLARALAPNGIAPLGLAPALGWAVFNATALPALSLIGFDRLHVALLCLTALAAAWLLPSRRRLPRLPVWALPLAGAAALLPMMALLPKDSATGLLLAPPMFDHVKVAIVDGIVRSGLPVQNPFIGMPGSQPLAYYYLWHFSAGVLASGLGTRGWTADAAMTGFTAFASLTLTMTIAQVVGRRGLACAFVAVFAIGGTVRPLLDLLLGRDLAAGLMPRDADLGGWLVQAAWVPQHLVSACCMVTAALLMIRLAEDGRLLVVLVLGLVAVAGFESSTWIGGLTMAVVAPVTGIVLLLALPAGRRVAFIVRAGAAASVTAAFAWPFLAAQLASVSARGGGVPVALTPYRVLGSLIAEAWRPTLDLPAFWLLLGPAGLPAIWFPGLLGILQAVRRLEANRPGLRALAAAVGGCLAVTFLLRSTIDNNDLGWRAVLPAILLLTGFAAGFLARLTTARRWWPIAAVLLCVALGLLDGIETIGTFASGLPSAEAAGLARSPALWDALRRVTGPDERIVNNPLFVSEATPWPVDISWALLSNRPSCYAGWESVIAYGALSRARVGVLDTTILRVFGGHAVMGDVDTLAWRLDCRVALVIPSDGAWTSDPFASSRDYVLIDAAPDKWRIYRRRDKH